MNILPSGVSESTPKTWLIQSLKRQGILKSSNVEDALISVPREEFLWDTKGRALAYLDEPQKLGNTGQTISAPHMVVIMLEQLELESGMRILEVGTGSGYNTALIANIVSRNLKEPQKLVVTVEQDAELVRFAAGNIRRVGYDEWVQVVHGNGSLGYPERSDEELYDRILVAAAAQSVPECLKAQLKDRGILEIPLGNALVQRLVRIRKFGHGTGASFDRKNLVRCSFVPLLMVE